MSEETLDYKNMCLSVIVIGASGDLAKKKTYPSLFELYHSNLLPKHCKIWGFARSSITDEGLRNKIRPFLQQKIPDAQESLESFLKLCFYQQAKAYDEMEAFQSLVSDMKSFESEHFHDREKCNRLFYFAIPPNLFGPVGICIKQLAMADLGGWTRLIVEKPFGRDLDSCRELLKTLSDNFDEDNLYRIDHYLGKEMVQNLLTLRFSNLWYERLFNRDNISCVFLTFKENFGTQGRGGYFDQYGIIRDIIQNHLTQVMCLLAMEPPTVIAGADASHRVRDSKVAVLSAIKPIRQEDVLLGQYEGYTDDETITNKDTNTPTFALIRCYINNARWDGVPFIFKAGKELEERKAEMRIQFKAAPASEFLFNMVCPRNELILRIQPNEAIYIKTNVKSPGFNFDPVQSELEVNYDTRFFHPSENDTTKYANPEAYSRLILDVIRGNQAHFVRDDELIQSWRIFTPLLHDIEAGKIKPKSYKPGSRGPEGCDEWVAEKSGFVRNARYEYGK